MEQHRGEIVEAAIRKSGYQIKKLAKRLGLSRNTLYNRLKEPNLGSKFIHQVGRVIHYDFSIDFPDIIFDQTDRMMDDGIMYKNSDLNLLKQLEVKYTRLLEDYNELLKILVALANANDFVTVKEEIYQFLYKNDNGDTDPFY